MFNLIHLAANLARFGKFSEFTLEQDEDFPWVFFVIFGGENCPRACIEVHNESPVVTAILA